MSEVLFTILYMSVPLILATLGALVSERAGVLAVFMDGAITLSGCIAIGVTLATGSALAGLLAACLATVGLLFAVAVFTERTRANPFLTGLSVNLLSVGLTSWLSASLFGTRGVVDLAERGILVSYPETPIALLAVSLAPLLAFVFRSTSWGMRLSVSGVSGPALESRGRSPARYRIASWCVAAFFASLAGASLAFRLGAFVPNLSAGRGWTALAACYLGYRRPIPCLGAVFVFTIAEYATNALQGSAIPGTVILGLPYALSLLVFALIPSRPRVRSGARARARTRIE